MLLAIAAAGAVLASCKTGGANQPGTSDDGSKENNSGSGTTVTTDDGLYSADYLPDKTYNNYKLISVSIQDAPQINLFKDSESLDKTEVAQYKAIERIKEKYKLDIEETYKSSWQQLSENVESMFASNLDEADFNMLIQREAWRLGIMGYLADWDDLIYCDETQPWYIQGINDQQRVLGYDFVNYTWASISAYGSALACYFNQDLVASLQLDSPYDLVDNNKWTVDKQFEMIRAAVSDLNSDGLIDDNDRVGMVGTHDDMYPSMWMGAGFRLVTLDSDGTPAFTADQNEAFITYLEKLSDLTNENSIYNFNRSGMKFYEGDMREDVLRMFKDGKSLFITRTMNTIIRYGDAEINWGMVPNPKLDDNQKNYISRICDVWYNECVPATSAHKEEASVFIEAYAIESLNYVVDAYYRQTLQNRYSDEKTKEMLDVVRSSVTLDLGDTIWQDYCRNFVLNTVTAGDKAFKSTFDSIKIVVASAINRDLKMVEERKSEQG